MLRACRRLLRPGGRTAFFTITVTDGLPAQRHRRATRAGPRAVTTPHPTVDLLRRAGFVDVGETDVTEAYLQTATAWVVENDMRRDALRPPDPGYYDERMKDRREAAAGIREGLLRRSLLVARAGSAVRVPSSRRSSG